MLSPRSVECDINGDQPTVTNSVGVSGTNSDTATEADESDVGDEISSEEDSRCGCESCDGWDEEDGSASSEFSYGEREDEECPPGFWDDDDDDDDFDKNSEDEDSDQRSSEQDVSKAPLMKRAKTSHAVAASSSYSKSVRRKSLSLLPTMPFDILFEILSHLSPTDIVNLSHISKVFHKTLSSRNAPAVWKAVRRRFSAPDGPDWMSDDSWVELLFGRNCQLCGKSNTNDCVVDFLLLKRTCVSCGKRNYISGSKVEKRYPDFDFVILLVPSTNRSPWNLWIGAKHYYWKLDLDSMVSKLAALKQDADTQLLHRFMEERKRRLQCIRQNSSSWREWYIRMTLDRDHERRVDEGKRLVQIKDKFKELGYIEEDLGILYHQKEYLGPGKIQMTAKIWSRIRPLLEPAVKDQKARRLERQRAIIKQNRRWILSTRYKEFQCTLHPSQWKYLPRTLEIAAFEGFSRHIEADVEVEVDGTTFDDTFVEFPTLLTAATDQRKKTLRALIVDSPIEFEDGEIGADPIDVATAVFKCVEVHNFPRPFKYVFGWDEIASHHCLPESISNSCYTPESTLKKAPPELKYIPEIALVVRKLAPLIGLDAASATAADFDNIDKRFTCDACPFPKDKGQYSQTGYTWRNLAVHLELSKTHNPNLFITVLSDKEEEELKQRERNDRKWDANRWTCSHCPEYISDLQHRQIIVDHLSASHGIQEPSEPTDLLFFERCRTDWTTTRFIIPAANPPKFRCLVCVTKTDRQFTLNGVEAHLRAKHKIPSEQISLHYARA